ncbi:uncharacterized protein LOC143188870 [Calliopsis andreniformis]|uniref:uncharacterized protein LOC143188870 n=1 Tax=Calliopsis andreniformis TaxID=337506 RepID=UPI003FCD0CC7
MPFRSVARAKQKPEACRGWHIRWSQCLGPRTSMKTLLRLALGLVIIGHAAGASNAEGPVCGDVRCSSYEYCNDYHSQCEPCSSICDENDKNYQIEVCQRKCQAYVRHMRFLLRVQYENLQGEVERLWTLVTIAITTACLSLLVTLCLLVKRLACWKKLCNAFRRTFTGKWLKRTNNVVNANNNATSNNNNRETQSDAEAGVPRQNGLKLTMPTISATVAPSRNSSGNGNSSGSGSATGVTNTTPNTTITTLSRRHPSEDTTLDYAYDNPAMTPSPEAVQLRTKRESSF